MPGTLVDGSKTEAALEEVERRYAGASGEERQRVDAVLDVIGAGAGYEATPAKLRLGALREQLATTTPGPGSGEPVSSLARAAVALAAAPFDPRGYCWDPEATTVWVSTLNALPKQ